VGVDGVDVEVVGASVLGATEALFQHLLKHISAELLGLLGRVL